MSFIKLATKDQIPSGTMLATSAGDKELLLVNYEGTFYALDLKCTHMGGNLSKGILEGKIITCPRHGAKFDITTGKCISGPKLGFMKPSIKDENIYTVKTEGDNILVDI
jgi:3-phenylpropionate/trans-cinnamate dioxygenase ferredoxin subunit